MTSRCWALGLLMCVSCGALAQQSAPAPPVLSHRPSPNLESQGKMKIDVVVTADSGTGFGFTLSDGAQIKFRLKPDSAEVVYYSPTKK